MVLQRWIIIFTWLNTVATITNVVKLDVVTIHKRVLFEGSV